MDFFFKKRKENADSIVPYTRSHMVYSTVMRMALR